MQAKSCLQNKSIHPLSPWFMVMAIVAALFLFFAPGIPTSKAAFELNFDPSTTSGHSYTSTGDDSNYSCNMSYMSDFGGCAGGGFGTLANEHDDGSAHYQRMFTSGGKTYYHVIIGDKDVDTMYMEYMIEANTGWNDFGGGFGSSFAGSASNGDDSSETTSTENMDEPYKGLTSRTGTGSGNPERVVMRMILDDGVTYSEFLKDSFANKPLITQTVTDAVGGNHANTGISAEFTMDMRSLSYSDNTTGIGEATNITILTGSTSSVIAADQGNYDTTDVVYTPHFVNQNTPNTSAGKFTYTPISNDNSDDGGAGGTYVYVETSGFQPVVDYSGYCDPSVNVDWSGSGACTDDGGAGGGFGGFGGW